MTPNQQRIMIFLLGRVDARSREITDGLDIGLSTFQSCVPDLYSDGFVVKTKVGSASVCRYLLTEDGQAVAKRLARYQTTSQLPTPYMLINKMTLPEYVPPSIGYQRNNGHAHIQSRGFA